VRTARDVAFRDYMNALDRFLYLLQVSIDHAGTPTGRVAAAYRDVANEECKRKGRIYDRQVVEHGMTLV
jgi:hypothetical protein